MTAGEFLGILAAIAVVLILVACASSPADATHASPTPRAGHNYPVRTGVPTDPGVQVTEWETDNGARCVMVQEARGSDSESMALDCDWSDR